MPTVSTGPELLFEREFTAARLKPKTSFQRKQKTAETSLLTVSTVPRIATRAIQSGTLQPNQYDCLNSAPYCYSSNSKRHAPIQPMKFPVLQQEKTTALKCSQDIPTYSQDLSARATPQGQNVKHTSTGCHLKQMDTTATRVRMTRA